VARNGATRYVRFLHNRRQRYDSRNEARNEAARDDLLPHSAQRRGARTEHSAQRARLQRWRRHLTHANVAARGRQWCWMGWKEFGCHRVVNERKTWAEGQALAAMMRVTVPEKVASFQPLLRPELCEHRADRARSWTSQETHEASRWFKENVAVYIVNMDASIARWKTMTDRLARLEIRASRVPGVDMRRPGALDAAVTEGLIPESFRLEVATQEALKAKNNMDGGILGTVGCAAAHFRAQAQAHKDGRPLAVVLEDDVAPAEDFIVRLWSLVRDELPCDWEVLSLSSRCPYGECVSPHLMRVYPDGNEPVSRCRHGVNYGFQGVLYRTSAIPSVQRRWKQTVFDHFRPHCLDVDVALASISDEVAFYAVPFVQTPGLVEEVRRGSVREDMNR